MIEVDKECLSEKELIIANYLKKYLSDDFVSGKISDRYDSGGHTIRMECENDEGEKLILQVLVCEEKNSANLTNILIPFTMSNKGLATTIVTILLEASNIVDLDLFVTGFANERWRESLIRKGAQPYPYGDVLIEKPYWKYILKKKAYIL